MLDETAPTDLQAPTTEEQECHLLQRIASGERDAMRQFYLLYHRRLARFLARVTQRREIVEEAINDTLLVVWHRARTFRGDSRVSTWVMGIAWRFALKGARREGRYVTCGDVDPVEPVADLPFERLETQEWLSAALARLPPEQRAAVDLAYVGGFSCEEIGAIFGCSPNTVKTRLFYARSKLRAALVASQDRDVPRRRA
jgi:RNA polymerase sigma-70 factor (ECF subfamily)